jgi:hypothetical protein
LGDTGYLWQPLAQRLLVEQGVRLITRRRTKMHTRLMAAADNLLLRKRALSETIDDHLKTGCQIEHTRHRSPVTVLVHRVRGLVAYGHLPTKPALDLDTNRDRLAIESA